MTKILIVDDHPLFREALRSAVKSTRQDADILEAGSIEAAHETLKSETGIEIVLLDLSLPGTTGFDGLMLLRSSFPKIPIMIVSGLDNLKIVYEAIRLGAAGFVPKSVDRSTLAEGMTEVLNGSVFLPPEFGQGNLGASNEPAEDDIANRIADLTPAQMRVLQRLRHGQLNKQIAYELGVSETTIKAHVSEILRKLNVVSRTQAVIKTSQLDFDTILADSGTAHHG